MVDSGLGRRMQNNAQNTTHVSQQEEQKVSGVILDMWLTSDKKSTLGKILPAVVVTS